ncbi:MAG: 5'-nucleotidase C-terminal domain-containing protein [Candidatus Cryptobacteroides sp.]
MKKVIIAFFAASLACTSAFGQEISWRAIPVDGSRTGVTAPGIDSLDMSLGRLEGRNYVAPNGKVYGSSSVRKVFNAVFDAQAPMFPIREVVGYSPRTMVKDYPESPLSNWFIDNLMASVAKATGKTVEFGVGNFGGIRIDMPQGKVTLDDIRSMFPFKNTTVYVAVKGERIRQIIEKMAAGRFQVLGGVNVTVKDGKVSEIKVGGEPLDDAKVYGMATISFLLEGGDGLTLADGAVEIIDTGVDIFDAMIECVRETTAAGKPIEYFADGRIKIEE